MEITNIWMSQLTLRRSKQIPAMVVTLNSGGILPPIVLAKCEDGEVQVEVGKFKLKMDIIVLPQFGSLAEIL